MAGSEKNRKNPKATAGSSPTRQHLFRLYIAGPGGCSSSSLRTLLHACNSYLPGRHRIEVIDICQQPELAREAKILATPTLVKVHPSPMRQIVGRLSDRAQILRGLGILQ